MSSPRSMKNRHNWPGNDCENTSALFRRFQSLQMISLGTNHPYAFSAIFFR